MAHYGGPAEHPVHTPAVASSRPAAPTTGNAMVIHVRDKHSEPSAGTSRHNTPVTTGAALHDLIRRRARPTRRQKPDSAGERGLG
jgi:hypothetical protein